MTVAGLRARALSLTRPASRVRVGPNAGAALLALALLTPLAATNGGYFPTSWGWAALVPLWVSVLALSLAAEVRLSRLELAFLAALAALAGWILLSTLWTSSPTATVLEAERALVYPAGVLAALLLPRRASASPHLGRARAALPIDCAYPLPPSSAAPGRRSRSSALTRSRRASSPTASGSSTPSPATGCRLRSATGTPSGSSPRWARCSRSASPPGPAL